MTTNGKPPKATDRVRELAAYIADEPDDKTNPTIVNVHVEQTGRHQAVKGNEEITQTDHGVPRAQQDSIPEKMADAAGELVQKADTWPRVVALGLLLLTAVAAYVAKLYWGR